MGKCKMYTLNVNGFEQDTIVRLKNLVDKMNLSDDDIVVLQEIPHKELNKSTRPWKWEISPTLNSFQEEFSNYKVILPIHLIDSNQCTVAICTKESNWQGMDDGEKIIYDKKFSYGNKLIEVQYDSNCKLSLLGLHMNPCEEMWDLVLNSERKDRHTFIIGDFNAYEYRGEMKDKPLLLRGLGFVPLVSSNTITYYKGNSSVDNLYVSNGFGFEKGILVKVEDISDAFKTDHALCSVAFDI